MVKNLPVNAGEIVGKIPRRREWQFTAVFLPGKSRGHRSLVGYSPRVAELDMTEHTGMSRD